MRHDDRSEDLGDITRNRVFLPALVWAGALAAACGMALIDPPQEPSQATARTNPPASSPAAPPAPKSGA